MPKKEEAKPKEEPKKEAPKKEEPKEVAPAEKEAAKPEKTAKPEKKKKPDKKIYTMYKVEQDKVSRLRPTCERCGTGYFMADHGNRYTCGHCGFTKYKRVENEHV
jgi:ubiquitin-small subunit ribosomal protein S27Ae